MKPVCCSRCGAALEHAATGRPRRYCSKACKRLVEFEILRLQTEMTRLLEQESELQRYAGQLGPAYAEEEGRYLSDRMGALQERLRVLCG